MLECNGSTCHFYLEWSMVVRGSNIWVGGFEPKTNSSTSLRTVSTWNACIYNYFSGVYSCCCFQTNPTSPNSRASVCCVTCWNTCMFFLDDFIRYSAFSICIGAIIALSLPPDIFCNDCGCSSSRSVCLSVECWYWGYCFHCDRCTFATEVKGSGHGDESCSVVLLELDLQSCLLNKIGSVPI